MQQNASEKQSGGIASWLGFRSKGMGRDFSGRALTLGVQGILVLLVVPPLVMLFIGSITQTLPDGSHGDFTFEHYRKIFTEDNLYLSLWNSVVFSVCATILSLFIGAVMAWIVERTDAPMKWLAYLTTVISMGTPYVLYVASWIFLFGRVGPFNSFYSWLTGETEPLFSIYSLGGMIIVEGFLWSPLVFLMLSATFKAANAELEEAARMSGATVGQTVRRVSLPLTMPAMAALAVFIFIRNLEAFDVPALIGIPGRISVLTTEVYNDLKQIPPDLGHASAFSVIMLVIVAGLLYLYSRVSRHADRYASVTGKGFRPRPFRLGSLRMVAGAIIVVNFLVILGLPFIALIWSSLMPFARGMSIEALDLVTLKNFKVVLSSPYYAGFAFRTIMISGLSATFIVILTLVAGWIAARRRPGGAFIDQVATMPLVFPGIVLGMSVLEIGIRAPFPLYGTVWIIGLAYVIRYLPYGMRYSYAGTIQIHRELEEAGAVSGANTLGILRRIVAPLLSPAILAGWLFIFLLSAKELSIALLLAAPGTQTIAVAMFDLWSNGQGGELSAFGLLWTAFMTICALVFYLFANRSSSQAYTV